MQNVKNRGLSGKARHAHYERRAARLRANQLVMNYFESDSSFAEGRPERTIPVRRYRDSPLPPSATFEHVAYAEPQQLESGLSEPEPAMVDAVCLVRARPPARDPAEPSTGQEHTGTTAQAVRDAPGLHPVGPAEDSPAPFTIGGFICGCAIGAAAAAVALLVLQSALR